MGYTLNQRVCYNEGSASAERISQKRLKLIGLTPEEFDRDSVLVDDLDGILAEMSRKEPKLIDPYQLKLARDWNDLANKVVGT